MPLINDGTTPQQVVQEALGTALHNIIIALVNVYPTLPEKIAVAKALEKDVVTMVADLEKIHAEEEAKEATKAILESKVTLN